MNRYGSAPIYETCVAIKNCINFWSFSRCVCSSSRRLCSSKVGLAVGWQIEKTVVSRLNFFHRKPLIVAGQPLTQQERGRIAGLLVFHYLNLPTDRVEPMADEARAAERIEVEKKQSFSLHFFTNFHNRIMRGTKTTPLFG